MPKLNSDNIKIIDGVAVLFRRSRSSAWQVRYKANGRWLRSSTKAIGEIQARKVAEDIVLEARFRQKLGLPIVTRRFASVARIVIARMQAAQELGEAKSVYAHYIGSLENYLIPYLGNHGVAGVDAALLRKFAVWRAAQMRREPKSSTVNLHNVALTRVFDVALELGYMNKAQLPMLVSKPRDSERRPDFAIDEYRRLYRYMRGWVKAGRVGKSRDMRELLRDYVLILANTGMRHGTESMGLKWKHVSEFVDDDRRYLAMWVDGKTGGRELIARHNCVTYLKRIHARAADLKHLSWDELLKAGRDELVFRLSDGTASKSLHQTFEVLLKDAGLLVDRRTDQNRTLYSLRHTYATLSLVHARVDIHTLAQQMGTSILMIERHYSHLKPRQRAEQLAGGLRGDKTDKKALTQRHAAKGTVAAE